MNQQLPELSAFFDDELEDRVVAPLLDATLRDSEMKTAWQTYSLIGDHLRKEPSLAVDMTASVMARLQEEPVVLAPRNLPARRNQHPLLALAASVAGVAVVAWLAVSLDAPFSRSEGKFAAVSPAPTIAAAARPSVANPAAAPLHGDMNEYLLAHQTHASSYRLGDSTEHVRTVALSGRPVGR